MKTLVVIANVLVRSFGIVGAVAVLRALDVADPIAGLFSGVVMMALTFVTDVLGSGGVKS